MGDTSLATDYHSPLQSMTDTTERGYPQEEQHDRVDRMLGQNMATHPTLCYTSSILAMLFFDASRWSPACITYEPGYPTFT
jgi:hypothetical protein